MIHFCQKLGHGLAPLSRADDATARPPLKVMICAVQRDVTDWQTDSLADRSIMLPSPPPLTGAGGPVYRDDESLVHHQPLESDEPGETEEREVGRHGRHCDEAGITSWRNHPLSNALLLYSLKD